MMQYSGKRPAQKSLLCEFRHKEQGPCLALLYLLLYVINNTHIIQVENYRKNLYLHTSVQRKIC